MSLSLENRLLRAEGRIESLLLGLDETMRHAYESLLERSADYSELSDEKRVARLEGFHDYVITREETGVEHPSLKEYILARSKFGDDMLSFGTGKHRVPIEGESERTTEYVEDESVEESIEDTVDVSEHPVTVQEVVETTIPEESDTILVGEVRETEWIATELSDKSNDVPEDLEDELPLEVDEDEFDDTSLDTNSIPVFADEDDVIIEGENTFDEDDKKEEHVDVVEVRLTVTDLVEKNFSRKLGGYSDVEVDDYLDSLVEILSSEDTTASTYKEKAEEAKNKTFPQRSFKKGFAANEVDEFLADVAKELEIRSQEV